MKRPPAEAPYSGADIIVGRCDREHVGPGLIASKANEGRSLHVMGGGVPHGRDIDHVIAALWTRRFRLLIGGLICGHGSTQVVPQWPKGITPFGQ
jgi:hypothetical protein